MKENFFSILKHPLLYIIIIFSMITIFWIHLIPYPDAPDENIHFERNVKFILDNKRLPIAGTDDFDLIEPLRENSFGGVSYTYSYNNSPQMNYLISAAMVKIITAIRPDISTPIASRYASFLWGISFVFFLFQIMYHITRDRHISTWVTILVAFIPQVIFISAYTNQDIHSLAISAILMYTLLRFIDLKSNKNLIWFSIACALLLVAKLNYYVYIPFVAGYFLYAIIVKKEFKFRYFIKISVVVGSISFILSGFWFFRNYILYDGDILGQQYLTELATKLHGPANPQSFSLSSLTYLFSIDYFYRVFKSFFAWFSWLGIALEDVYYRILLVLLVVLFGLLVSKTFVRREKKNLLIRLTYISFCFSSLFLLLTNTFSNDLQPQGRYLFPILVPTAMIVAYSIREKSELLSYVKIVVIYMCFLLMLSIKALLVNYQDIKLPAYKVEGTGQPIAELMSENILGKVVQQTFISENNFLTEIMIEMNMDKLNPNGTGKAWLLDEKDTVIAESTFTKEKLIEEGGLSFKFKPIIDSKNKDYKIKILIAPYSNEEEAKIYYASYDTDNSSNTWINEDLLAGDIYYHVFYREEETYKKLLKN